MKKFIITGGSGFIGSNLVKFLLKKNYFVINSDKLSYSANPYNLKEMSNRILQFGNGDESILFESYLQILDSTSFLN